MDQPSESSVGAELDTRRVMARFGVRLLVLAAFALASSQPFWAVLTTLLVVAAGLSAILAASRGEPVFGSVLTHWDEAAVYALLSRGLAMLAAGAQAG